MTTANRVTVAGVFSNPSEAQRAFAELRQAGFRDEHLGVLAKDAGVKQTIRGATDQQSAEGATAGAAAGAAAGAGLGAAAGTLVLATGMIPVIGPVIAGGTLALLLGTTAAGAATGGIVGTLFGRDITEDEFRHYETDVREGRLLVTVQADERWDKAVEIMRRCGGIIRSRMPAAGA